LKDSGDLEILRGTLDLLILKTLSWGPLHGYAIAAGIKRISEECLLVEEGALYPCLHRMQAKEWLNGRWGLAESGRRAKFYELTPIGRKQLVVQTKTWHTYAHAVNTVLRASRMQLLER
jgi:PadR family transcriptional regulator, regulatory protein PadR